MIDTQERVPWIMLGSFQQNNFRLMKKIVFMSVAYNCTAFDTAPSYGSEEILGKAIEKCIKNGFVNEKNIFLSDKIDAIQMCKSKGEIRPYVLKSLKKLKREYLDLLLIHWPIREYFDATWRCMQRIKKEGIVKNIGVCNIDRNFYKEKEKQIGFKPDYIQNEISPLNVDEENIVFFKSRGVHIIAYSPLCRMCHQVCNSDILNDLSAYYQKSIPQIILKWHIQKGIIPIFSSHSVDRISNNLEINDFELDIIDIYRIDSMDMKYKIFPLSYGCPGY